MKTCQVKKIKKCDEIPPAPFAKGGETDGLHSPLGLWSQRLLGILMLFVILNFGFGVSDAHADWTTGKYNSAMDFNGETTFVDGFGAIGNIKSVSFWIKADDITSRKIMDFDGVDQIEIDSSSNILATSFPGTVAIYIDGVNKTASPTIDTDWHHIAITTDTNVSASAVVIGKVSASFFDGKLDDVKIYAYARSADEILLDYNAGVATHLGPSGKTCAEDPAGCMDYGLVGSWGFDEGAGATAYDSSDNSNDGSLEGGPKWTTDSSPLAGGGGSLQFDGVDDYVGVGDTSEGTAELTISVWLYRKNYDTFDGIISHTNGSSASDGWWFSGILNDELNFAFDDRDFASTIFNLPLNTWTHIVLTFSDVDNVIKYYKNGSFVENVVANYSITESASDLRIGLEGSAYGDQYFNGSIDSVRIYNRALSEEEVRYHYNKGGPVAEWKFDEGSGQTAFDESFNNNDGTLGATAGVEASDPTWVEGKYGGALSFDGGDDYVDCGNDESTDFRTGDYSISFWAYRRDTAFDDIVGRWNEGVDTTSDAGFDIVTATNNRILFFSGSRDDYIYSNINKFFSNQWHYVTVSRVGINLKIYIDGVFDVEDNSGLADIRDISSTNLKIGENMRYGYYKGSIDEVRIYNYARSADEILLDYNNGVATHFR